MDIYHIWCDLKDGVGDKVFVDAATAYLEQLQSEGYMAAWRITRRKLGLGPPELGEFHLILEFEGLARLDEAFGAVSTRAGPVEHFHHGVNSLVRNLKFALYRDFPDADRVFGEEKF